MLEAQYDDVKTLNGQLKTILVELAEETPGTTRSNAGGWHSEEGINLFDTKVPPLQDLHRKLQHTAIRYFQPRLKVLPKGQEYVTHISAWSIINKDGDYNNVHTHPNAHGSGVYYVDIGRPTRRQLQNGYLEFVDPHPADQMVYCQGFDYRRQLIKPGAGKVVMFPPWLQHQVHVFRGKGTRICIAFNMLVSIRSSGGPHDVQNVPAQ